MWFVYEALFRWLVSVIVTHKMRQLAFRNCLFVIVCLSIRPSITIRHCTKMAKHRITQITSVVTVSKILLSVGFGRFLHEKPRFSVRFRFLSVPFSPRDVNTRVRWIPRPESSIPGPERAETDALTASRLS